MKALLYDFSGELLTSLDLQIGNVGPNQVLHLNESVMWPSSQVVPAQVLFLRMELYDKESDLIDRNEYWLSDPTKPQNNVYLDSLQSPGNIIPLTVEASGYVSELVYQVSVNFLNPNPNIAFFISIGIETQTNNPNISTDSDNRILPVWYTSNYFSLLPQEEFQVQLEFTTQTKMDNLVVVVEGWNLSPQIIPIIILE